LKNGVLKKHPKKRGNLPTKGHTELPGKRKPRRNRGWERGPRLVGPNGGGKKGPKESGGQKRSKSVGKPLPEEDYEKV